MTRPFALPFAFALAACGGSVVTIDGGTQDAASGADATTPRDGGGPDAALDASKPDCDALAMKLEPLRTAARKCTNSGVTKPCNQFVKDLCCAISVTDANSPASKALAAAVDEYLKLCEPPPCPPVVCPDNPSGTCLQDGICLR